MKVNNLNNFRALNLNNTNSNRTNKTRSQSFNGILSTVATKIGDGNIKFMDFIAKYGFPAEFCVMDFCGMAAPRSLQGFNRNKEELGHWNVVAGLEELIREGITGPSMFLIPAGALFLASKFLGKGAKISVENLDALSNILKTVSVKNVNSDNAKREFAGAIFDKIFSDMKNVATFTQDRVDFINSLTDFNSATKDKIKQGNFIGLMNNLNAKYFRNANTNLVTLNLSHIENNAEVKNTIKTNTENLFLNARNYMDDLLPTVQQTLKEDLSKGKQLAKDMFESAVDKITDIRKNCRKFTCLTGTIALAAFLCIIPKLYQLSKKNPALDGLQKGKDAEVQS